MTQTTKCGFIAIVGRPNVGKSTLLNAILAQKLSITSRKAQTTRHRILGVKNTGDVQAIYVDTPGFHQHEKQALNRYMNRTVLQALRDVDVILLVVDATSWQVEDDLILEKLKGAKVPVILVLNKIDKVKDKERLLPLMESLSQRYPFQAIIPVSAEKGLHLDALETAVGNLLPYSVHLYPEGQNTDRGPRFFAAELVREKLLRLLGQEVPHNLTVTIEEFSDQEDLIKVSALIVIERASQKPIVVGKNGEKLKQVGTLAREEMEQIWHKKVFLKL